MHSPILMIENFFNIDKSLEHSKIIRFGLVYFSIFILFIVTILFLPNTKIHFILPRILSIIALLVLSFPVLKKLKLDVFEPIVFFVASFFFGGVLRTCYLVSSSQASMLPYGVELFSLTLALVWSILGFICLQWGYNNRLASKIASTIPTYNDKTWNKRRLWLVVTAFSLVGLIAYSVFLESTGGIPTNLTEFSMKRNIRNGYIRWGVELLYIAFLLAFGNHLKQNLSLRSFRGIILVLLAILALSFPFLTSSRGSMLTLLLLTLFIYHYYKRRVEIRKLVILITIFAMIVVIMGGLRRASYQGLVGFYKYNKGGMFPAFQRIFVEGHYLFDITTFARLVQDVPEQLSFQWGSTLINWVFWPIPRNLWAEKPINLGQRIGAQIYNQGVGVVGGGVPPPFIAELYLNFHLAGIIVGMFFFGLFSRSLYLHMLENRDRITTLLIYAVTLRSLWGLFQSDLTQTMVGYLQWMVPLVVSIHFITHGRIVRTVSFEKKKS